MAGIRGGNVQIVRFLVKNDLPITYDRKFLTCALLTESEEIVDLVLKYDAVNAIYPEHLDLISDLRMYGALKRILKYSDIVQASEGNISLYLGQCRDDILASILQVSMAKMFHFEEYAFGLLIGEKFDRIKELVTGDTLKEFLTRSLLRLSRLPKNPLSSAILRFVRDICGDYPFHQCINDLFSSVVATNDLEAIALLDDIIERMPSTLPGHKWIYVVQACIAEKRFRKAKIIIEKHRDVLNSFDTILPWSRTFEGFGGLSRFRWVITNFPDIPAETVARIPSFYDFVSPMLAEPNVESEIFDFETLILDCFSPEARDIVAPLLSNDPSDLEPYAIPI